jgi:hypothetical protein
VTIKNLQWKVVSGGALSALITAGMGLGVALLGSLLLGWESGTRTGVFTAAAFLGFLLGGFRAALLLPSAALANGAASGALAAIPITAIGVVQGGRNPASIVFAVGMAAVIATLGAMVGVSNNKRSGRRDASRH